MSVLHSEMKRVCEFPVYVVDDSTEMCLSLDALLSAYGCDVSTFGSPLEFLGRIDDLERGILLIDLRMDDLDGLEVLRRLDGYRDRFSIIMMTAHGDVEIAVKAIKIGASDFIQKPFRDEALLGMIAQAATELSVREDRSSKSTDMLTGRERDVAERLAKGLSNKQISYDLGISVRTVEMHRARAMQRLGCKSFAELLRALLHD